MQPTNPPEIGELCEFFAEINGVRRLCQGTVHGTTANGLLPIHVHAYVDDNGSSHAHDQVVEINYTAKETDLRV